MELDKYAEKLKAKVSDRNFDGTHLPHSVDSSPWPESTLPLCLEVGCGAGLHPVLFAKQSPEFHLIALERTKEKFDKFKRRIEKNKIDTVTPLFEDALHWLYPHREKAKNCFEKIFLLYPNPYPKVSQRNKRFLAAPSFQFLLSTLKTHGTIELRSNELFYIEEAIFLAKNVWNLTVDQRKLVKELEVSQQGVTHFERKYLKDGQDCYQVIFSKN